MEHMSKIMLDIVIDLLIASFFGANAKSAANLAGAFLILGTCLATRSWLTLYIALTVRALNFVIYYLIRLSIHNSSTPRKVAIIAQVRREQEAYESKGRPAPRPEDDEWEKIERHAVGSAENGQRGGPETQWDGVIGFLHPFCNAGGGGERVLWAGIKAIQERYPRASCVVYTGDHDSSKSTILERVSKRFDIHLHHPTITFLYLSTRGLVVASRWPHFTLLGQALGSLFMAYDAYSLMVPDVFVDTMGYAFSTAFCKIFFPEVPTGAYVHYPFIGTHMVESLTLDSGRGINAGSGKGLKGIGKTLYWQMLVSVYTLAGRSLDVVMANSSWTRSQMVRLWGPYRRSRQRTAIEVVFPPVAVEEIIDTIPLDGPGVIPREKKLVYIAQFRPEKDHELILQSFAKMVHGEVSGTEGAQLVLIGSVRDSEDETLVYKLRLLARELKIEEKVEFRTKDVSWPEILEWLRKAWVGVNGMWCEHFGIGVVEYQAAGLISVVNDSGGPKQDIVVDVDGGATGKLPQSDPSLLQLRFKSTHHNLSLTSTVGFHASNASEYAANFTKALTIPPKECNEMRHRARASSKRFTTARFAAGWIDSLQKLIAAQTRLRPPPATVQTQRFAGGK